MIDDKNFEKIFRKMRDEDPKKLAKALSQMDVKELKPIINNWRLWARDSQLPPEGDWRYWTILAGRGLTY